MIEVKKVDKSKYHERCNSCLSYSKFHFCVYIGQPNLRTVHVLCYKCLLTLIVESFKLVKVDWRNEQKERYHRRKDGE